MSSGSENMRPRPPSRSSQQSSSGLPASSSPAPRPASPRVVLQPIALKSTGKDSLIDDRTYISSIKADINQLLAKNTELSRELELQRRAVPLASKGLPRRPTTPADPSLSRQAIEEQVARAMEGKPGDAKLALMEVLCTTSNEVCRTALQLTDKHFKNGPPASTDAVGLARLPKLGALLQRVDELNTIIDGEASTRRIDSSASTAASGSEVCSLLETTSTIITRVSSHALVDTIKDILEDANTVLSQHGLPIIEQPDADLQAAGDAVKTAVLSETVPVSRMAGDQGMQLSQQVAESASEAMMSLGEANGFLNAVRRAVNNIVNSEAAEPKGSSTQRSSQALAGNAINDELIQEKMQSLEEENGNLRNRMRVMSADMEELQAKLDATSSVSQTNKAAEGHELQIKNLTEEKERLTQVADKLRKSEAALQTQFDLLKEAFDKETADGKNRSAEGPDAALPDGQQNALEALKQSELSARGELSMLKASLEKERDSSSQVEAELRAERQKAESLQRQLEDSQLQVSSLKGEVASLKRASDVTPDTFESVLADELCVMREAYEAKLSQSRQQLESEQRNHHVSMREMRETMESEIKSLRRRVDVLQAKTDSSK